VNFHDGRSTVTVEVEAEVMSRHCWMQAALWRLCSCFMLLARMARRIALLLIALCAAAGIPNAWALNPALDISQHGHRAWRNLDGFGLGTIVAIAQTVDGYMWLGTPEGLLRFDGVRSVRWSAPSGTALPDDNIRALLGTSDGALWIGTSRGLAQLKDGTLNVVEALHNRTVNAIEEDAEGTIWVAGAAAGKGFLCAVRQGGGECGDDGSLGRSVVSLYVDGSNSLWVAGTERVWKWGEAARVSYVLPAPIFSLGTMTGGAHGAVVVGTQGHLMKLADGKAEAMPLPQLGNDLSITKILLDRDGALWLGVADAGLLHIREGRIDTYKATDGLSGNQVLAIFEDREGNVWVSTTRGLDQFRAVAAAQMRSFGLEGRARAVLPARDGSMWAATTTGLYQTNASRTWELRRPEAAGLLEDREGRIWAASSSGVEYFENERFVLAPGIPAGPVDAAVEDSKGNLWIAHRKAGLLRWHSGGTAETTPWLRLGVVGRVSTMTVDPTDDSLWLGMWSGAIVNVRNGLSRTLPQLADASEAPRINQLRAEPDGALWVANSAGLTRIKSGRTARLDQRNGLPCGRVFWSIVDPQAVWIAAQCGLVRIERGQVDAWAAAADRGAPTAVKSQLLDHWDGITQTVSLGTLGQFALNYNFMPKLSRSADGMIWAATGDDIVRIDPGRLPINDLAPPVRVELLTSDGRQYESRSGLELPAVQRDLVIDYTALTFAVPEKVRFRYKLEGRDTDWQDAGQRRQAFYTDLGPGHYRFRAIAANASGLWNEEGDTLEFSIAPAWWQTAAFRAVCIAAFVLMTYGLYKLRIAQLSRRFEVSLEARVNERMRIARELHDTLLQTFQGLVLRLQTAHQLLPDGKGRRILEQGIDLAAEAITEGRDAVQGLRSAATEGSDLAEAIRALGQVLATDPAAPAASIGVEVQGRPRRLHPIVRDDVIRIVGEALRNAFHHAQPTQVEVEIRYDQRELCVRVRDDGRGMDQAVARRGREGHFGLHGMRERAQLIGGKLAFWTRQGAGTAVELSVPASRAYAEDAAALPSRQVHTSGDPPAHTIDT
jgi:signal transduction histidine kinase/ligand-binding sensor domain-containing protein